MHRNYKRFSIHSIQKLLTHLSIIHVIFNPHFRTRISHSIYAFQCAPVAQLSRAKTGATVATWVSPSVHTSPRTVRLIHVDIFEKDPSILHRTPSSEYPVGVVAESQHSLFLNHLHGLRNLLSLPLLLLLLPRSIPTESSGDSS